MHGDAVYPQPFRRPFSRIDRTREESSMHHFIVLMALAALLGPAAAT